MIIIFGNQKGGCGKTTNCIQFANYLADKGRQILVIDLDFQQSVGDRRKEDLEIFDNLPRYEVVECSLNKVSSVIDDFKKIENAYLLIDLPGKLDDDSLTEILSSADVIVIPYRYDKLTIDSTALFIKVLEYLKVKAKLIFLPNNVNKSIRYDTREDIKNILGNYGVVTSEIPARVAMERLNTIEISAEAKEIVKDAYEKIIDIIDL